VAGAFIVVATFAFSSSTSTSIDFAISIGATVVGLTIARTNLAIGIGIAFAAAGLVAGALIERKQRQAAPVVATVSSNGYHVYEQDRVAA
jgi:hypothetical protein